MSIIRKTPALETILVAFSKSNQAISVVDLVKQLQNKINKSTVYRILERLEAQGTLHSFLDKNGNKWYAKCNTCSNTAHFDAHPHFQCTICGTVDCVDVDIKVPNINKRKINTFQILIQGHCESCNS